MYQKKQNRILHIITLLLFLTSVTMALCGLSSRTTCADVETEIMLDNADAGCSDTNISDAHEITPSESEQDLVFYPDVIVRYEHATQCQEQTTEPAPECEVEESFRYYNNIALEYEMQELVWTACEETGCPYELALSVIYHESSYKNAIGDNGNSVGYMQVQPRWHYKRMERLGVTNLYDPLSNFRVGCDLLAELIEKHGSVESALTCYNTGKPGLSEYANKVLAYMNETFATEETDVE